MPFDDATGFVLAELRHNLFNTPEILDPTQFMTAICLLRYRRQPVSR